MSTEVVSVEPTSIPVVKTLPMKYKAMHYALVAFVSSQSNMDVEIRNTLLETLPIHKLPKEQLEFYESLVDFKKVETDIIKPMQKQRKLDEKQAKKLADKALKEKTPRQAKKVKEAPPVESIPASAATIDSETVASIAEPNNDVTPIKKATKKSAANKGCKKETKTTPIVTDEALVLEVVDEMKEEAYIPTDHPKENVPKKKVSKKKEAVLVTQKKEVYWMFIRNDVRYWTSDEMIQNGPVFENISNKEGDNDAGKLIGSLVDGGLCINK